MPAIRPWYCRAGLLAAVVACLVSGSSCPPRRDDVVYFLVSEIEPFHGDSYIVPLADPEHIAHARALIGDFENTDRRIVVANIARGGSDGAHTNRDLLHDGREWSWRVVSCEGFADTTVEIYDGWPTYVEEHLDDWFDVTGGVIGFWSYTVTRELDKEEVRACASERGRLNNGAVAAVRSGART